ncbi:hypothetical protein JCM3766R1_007182 [Sporobolomyces carnicolor]
MSGLSTTGAGGAAASSSSSVSSRFVSASDLEAAAQKRQEEWKAAYARIGQEPPAQDPEGEKYDPRSLWEKLNENKTKKQEAFEEQLKFKNHFRALDEEEISFLDSMIDESNEEELARQRMIKEELESFRKAVVQKSSSSAPTPAPIASSSSSTLNVVAGGGGGGGGDGDVKGKGKVAAPTGGAKKASKKKTLPGLVVLKKKKKEAVAPVAKTTTIAKDEGGKGEDEASSSTGGAAATTTTTAPTSKKRAIGSDVDLEHRVGSETRETIETKDDEPGEVKKQKLVQ